MPNNSPNPPKSPRYPPKSPRIALPTKSPKLFFSVINSPKPRNNQRQVTTQTNTSPIFKGPQLFPQKQQKRRKKKKSCYSTCCCVLFLGWIAVLFAFILQESWDPDGELAVKFMETEVLQDITGPNVELPGIQLAYLQTKIATIIILSCLSLLGLRLAKLGLSAHFPVVFIPGIVSTGLEVWQGHPCAQKHFR
jgi:hypothetical protein